jgi:hypothetical protein
MDELRASDADREAVLARLRAAAADGRIDHDELEGRVQAALAARTEAELVPLTRDLPQAPPPALVAEPGLPVDLRRRIAGALTADVICIAVWLATGADGHFWPVWVIFGTGIGIVVPLIQRALGVEEDERPSK